MKWSPCGQGFCLACTLSQSLPSGTVQKLTEVALCIVGFENDLEQEISSQPEVNEGLLDSVCHPYWVIDVNLNLRQ